MRWVARYSDLRAASGEERAELNRKAPARRGETSRLVGSCRGPVTNGVSLDNWQLSNTNPILLDYNNAAVFEMMVNSMKIRQQEGQLLFRLPLSSTSKKDYRRFALPPSGKQRSEVGIRRDDHPLFEQSRIKYRFVIGRGHPQVADVDGVMP